MKEHNTYKAIDLFCGIGGFRCALDTLGVETVLSSDIDAFACATYKANFGHTPLGDINKIRNEDIPDFDILTAGFPCQPFSFAGAKQGFNDETRGTLFFQILRILDAKRPKMFLLENVKGLKSHNGGDTLNIIEKSLSNLGYNIHWTILNTYDFGLPQYRERWYCVGFDKNFLFKFPEGENRGTKLRDIIDLNNTDKSQKLSDFEIARINHHFENVTTETPRVLHDNSMYQPNTKKGKHGVYSFQKSDGALRFHIGDRAKTQIQEAFYSCLDTYAPTIIANRTPKLWDIQRKLSVNEARKLQGFPDDFQFPVSNCQAYKQLGNSVAVPVVTKILTQMINTYAKD